jgi:hypothetical protein
MAPSTTTTKAKPVSGDIVSVFDLLHDAPLMAGENTSDYEALRASVLREVNPSNLVEQITARELVSIMWEERRLRWLRDAFINAELEDGINSKLEKLVQRDEVSLEEMKRHDVALYDYHVGLTRDFLTKHPLAVSEVTRLFVEASMSIDSTVSKIFVRHIKIMQDFDTLITSAMQHRNRAIADLERRKDKRQHLVEKMDAILVDG